MPNITITLSNIAGTTTDGNNIATADWSAQPANAIDAKGNITIGNANANSTVTFEIDQASSAAGWTLQDWSATPMDFTIDKGFTPGATSMAINDSPATWEYTLYLSLNGTDYFIDPKVINR
jgi:hypothetical protein